MNYLKTAILLAGLTALFMAAGAAIGGQQGMVTALFIALAMNVFAYWNADKLVLHMHGAREVGPQEAPHFYAIVERLAREAGMPMPKTYLMETTQPNAFATGRNPEHAAVAVTTGLLSLLNEREVTAVMAHELGHVKNRDTLIMTITATIAGAISMLANFAFFMGGSREHRSPVGAILVAILAPIAAMLVQFAISRTREYAADHAGAELSRDPESLASALAKIHNAARRIPNPLAERNPATAHLFIMNPLTGQGMDNLFSTHPSTENRIAALMELARQRSNTQILQPQIEALAPSTMPSSRRSPWSG